MPLNQIKFLLITVCMVLTKSLILNALNVYHMKYKTGNFHICNFLCFANFSPVFLNSQIFASLRKRSYKRCMLGCFKRVQKKRLHTNYQLYSAAPAVFPKLLSAWGTECVWGARVTEIVQKSVKMDWFYTFENSSEGCSHKAPPTRGPPTCYCTDSYLPSILVAWRHTTHLQCETTQEAPMEDQLKQKNVNFRVIWKTKTL